MEKLTKDLHFLNLPSSMWGIHVHPQYEYVGILHINISNAELIIDKGILLVEEKCGFKAKIFLNGFVTDIPNVTLDITSLSELSVLINLLHNKNMCRNVDGKEGYPNCLKLVDDELEENLLYCSMCQERYTLTGLTNNVVELKYEFNEIDISPPCDNISTNFTYEHNIGGNTDDYISETGHQNQCNPPSDKLVTNSEENEEKSVNTNEKQALCDYCGKMFSSGHRIDEHVLTHTQEKPFQCKTCQKSFSKGFNLRMHEHTHSGDRPYVCSECGKSYRTSSNLRTHTLSSHIKERKHICDICDMRFIYPRYLKLHMRKHTGERPFVCSICGKKFSKNIHLTIHYRTHTGEKPHTCDTCGKGFTTTGGLTYHKRVHHKNMNL